MPRFPSFVGDSGTVQSIIQDAEETINLYVARSDSPGSQAQSALFPAPGFDAWGVVNDVGGRGMAFVDNRFFAVMGPRLYEFDINGTPTDRGTVAVDQNPALIVYNGKVGNQLGIASGGNVYSYDMTTNTLSSAHMTGGFTHLAYAGGYGLALNPSTGFVRLSDLNDLSTWDPGQFFRRSLFADPWQALFVDSTNLAWLIGTDTFEVWQNTGTGTQPWAPLSGLNGFYGIAAPFAYSVSGQGNFWLAQNRDGIGRFVATKGGIPQSVGSNAFHTAVSTYVRNARINDAEVFSYEQEGQTFAICAFPGAQSANPSTPTVWAYGVEAQSWAKRGMFSNGTWRLWAPRVHAQAFGKHLVADRTTGTIWEMDTAFATDTDGNGIRRLRRSPHLNDEHKRHPVNQFELLMDVGLGLSTGQGSDPQVMLRVSDNGGRTWSNERIASAGRQGEWPKRVYWTRLGAAPDAVFEVSYTEPVPFRVVDAYVNNAEGS